MTQIVELTERPTVVVREHVPISSLPEFFGRVFTQVVAELSEQGMSPRGPAFALFHGAPTDVIDVEAGFPVADPIHPSGPVINSSLPACRAVQAMHIGPYDHLKSTYDIVQAAISGAGHTPSDVMWESYLSQDDDDPAGTETLVTWPFTE